jgi:glycosyltransferase 2 family protein
VIAVAGGVFVVRAIADQWDSVRSSLGDAEPAWLVAGLACAALGMFAVAVPWRRALALVGIEAPLVACVTWYFVGEIGKYVPGGIWPVVGRAELARRGGHPRSGAYASVALSLGALYLADMLLVAALLPLRFLDDGNDALWLLVLLPIGLLALHHRPLGWMVELAERAMKRKLTVRIPPWSASLGLVLRYIPAWLLIGTATWCVARAFDPGADWMTIAPAAMFSWVVGFLLVPVPGGVGVREAAFVALVGGSVPAGIRATVAVVARLVFMIVDALGALIGGAVVRRWDSGPPGSDAIVESPPDSPAAEGSGAASPTT